MKAGKTLVELANEIMRQANAKKDYIAPTGKMSMGYVAPPAGGTSEGVVMSLGNGPLGINRLAHQHIGDYTGIQKQYYDKMLEQAPELLTQNVNHWLGKSNEKRLVRTLDGRVRAMLSDRYRPLENSDLAEAILPVLQERELTVVSCEITERRMYIKAFDKRIEREIALQGSDPAHTFVRKDVCFPAITVSNSETGNGSLSVAAGLWTGGCTNFASFSDSRMRKYHVGQKALDSEDVYALLSDKTKRLTDAAVWAQTRDVVGSAFDTARFEELLGRVQQTTTQKIAGDVVEVIELVGDRFGFNKGERGSVLKHLIEGGDLSRYGLFNAVTRTAEDLEDYERATDFERAGGQIIELGRQEWERIAQAA